MITIILNKKLQISTFIIFETIRINHPSMTCSLHTSNSHFYHPFIISSKCTALIYYLFWDICLRSSITVTFSSWVSCLIHSSVFYCAIFSRQRWPPIYANSIFFSSFFTIYAWTIKLFFRTTTWTFLSRTIIKS